MRNILIVVIFCFYQNSTVFGQNECSTYFPFEEQKILEYTNYDKKGKFASKSISKVTVVDDIDNGLEAQLETQILDEQQEVLTEGSYQVKCLDNELRIDVSNLMSPEMTASFSHLEVSITGEPFTLPSSLEPGLTLPDASNVIKAGSGGVNFMNITIDATNRKVEEVEVIRTPAGQFDAVRISYDLQMKMLIKKSFKVVQWYAKDVGMVKSESYNAKGKLIDSSILTAVN